MSSPGGTALAGNDEAAIGAATVVIGMTARLDSGERRLEMDTIRMAPSMRRR
jgi:hypothetical protein